MQPDRSHWPEWARVLQHWGMNDIAASVLDSAGPLNFFLAQMVYLGQPFLKAMLPGGSSDALAQLFENQDESRSFATYLREENPRDLA